MNNINKILNCFSMYRSLNIFIIVLIIFSAVILIKLCNEKEIITKTETKYLYMDGCDYIPIREYVEGEIIFEENAFGFHGDDYYLMDSRIYKIGGENGY